MNHPVRFHPDGGLLSLCTYKPGLRALIALTLLLATALTGCVLALNEGTLGQAGVDLPHEGRWTKEEFARSLGKVTGTGVFALGFSVAPGYHESWPLFHGLIMVDGATPPLAEADLRELAR